MNEVPNQLPRLKGGKGSPGSGEVCAEQAVSWLVSGRLDLQDETDHPSCVQPVLNQLAIYVNDALPDERRGEMWPIILRQPGTAHPEMEPILSIRLACFLAQKVIHLTRRQDRKACEEAIAASLKYCDFPTKENAYAAAAAYAAANAYANAAYANANAAYNAANAAYNAANAAYNANTYAYAKPSDSWDALLDVLSEAQDECERLTGHVPAACDTQRLIRLGELVGTV
jgi:hypothetical protein